MQLFGGGEKYLTDQDSPNPNLLSNTTLSGDDSKWSFPVGRGDTDGKTAAQTAAQVAVSIPPFSSKCIFFANKDASGTVLLKNEVYLPRGMYTFSFYVWNARNGKTDGEAYDYKLKATLNGENTDLITIYILTKNEWNKVSVTFSAEGKMSDLSFNVLTGIPNGWMLLADWKLERGNTATPWCPSVLDYYPELSK